MKKKMIEYVISLLDPIGVYGLGPLDEYRDIAEKAYEYLWNKDYDNLRIFLTAQYPNKKDVAEEKLNIVINILVYIMDIKD